MKTFIVFLVNLIVCFAANTYQKQLYEGDACELPHDEPGICVRLSLCSSALELVKLRQHPKTCGFIGIVPIVCCSQTHAKITRLAEQKCKIFQSGIVRSFPSNGPDIVPILQSTASKQFLPSQKQQDNPIVNNPTNPQKPNSERNGNIGPTLSTLNPETSTAPSDISRLWHRNEQTISERSIPSGQKIEEDASVEEGETTTLDNKKPSLHHSPSLTNRMKKDELPIDNDPDDTVNSKFLPDNSKFVIGGVNAMIREFPHMAALGYTNGNKKIWLCGGSLVTEQYVVTAAHCLFAKDFGPVEWVRLGELNLAATIDHSDPQDYKVIRKIPHPTYKAPAVYHDIALLQLDRSIVITSYVKPACLFTQDHIPNDVELLATGWGLTKVGGNQSDILQKVELDMFSEEDCDKNYKNIATTRRLKYGILHNQQICVGSRSKEKDTCQGDSGGPLQIQKNDKDGRMFYLVGITSFGRSCGVINVPGVYTRISYYVPWLESVLWPND